MENNISRLKVQIQISKNKTIELEVDKETNRIICNMESIGEFLNGHSYTHYRFRGIFDLITGSLLNYYVAFGSTVTKGKLEDATDFITAGVVSHIVEFVEENRSRLAYKKMQKAVDIYLGKITSFEPSKEAQDTTVVVYDFWRSQTFDSYRVTKAQSKLKQFKGNNIEIVNPPKDLLDEIKQYNKAITKANEMRKKINNRIQEIKKEQENEK